MQLKVFHIGRQPYLATRDGGFFETAATLERLITAGLEEQQQADLAAWETSGSALPQMAEADASHPAPAAAETPVIVPELAVAEPVPDAPAMVLTAAVQPASLMLPRRPSDKGRAGTSWVTAGAARRGRVAQHWSARRKA
jgi:hypothetical protein